VEREVAMSRRQIQKEIDICLAARIECEKTGKNVLAKLHNSRAIWLMKKLEKAVELG